MNYRFGTFGTGIFRHVETGTTHVATAQNGIDGYQDDPRRHEGLTRDDTDLALAQIDWGAMGWDIVTVKH